MGLFKASKKRILNYKEMVFKINDN